MQKSNAENILLKIFYNNQPVAGTIARGEDMPFPLAKDPIGDTAQTNYKASVNVKNPVDSLTANQLVETERLYSNHEDKK